MSGPYLKNEELQYLGNTGNREYKLPTVCKCYESRESEVLVLFPLVAVSPAPKTSSDTQILE